MKWFRQLLFRWVVRAFLADFKVTERTLSDGEYASAMNEMAQNGAIKTYLNILVGNLIRRHLYIKDMQEGNWYLGQIAAIRKIQGDSKRWVEQNSTSDNPKT